MKLESSESENILHFSFGTLGYLGSFFWCLGVMMFSSPQTIPWSAALCVLVLVMIYPYAWRNVLTLRRLGLLLILVIPPLFFWGK